MGRQILRLFLFRILNKKTSLPKPYFFISILILVFAFMPGKIFAQITYTWTGTTSTAWNLTGNWTKSSGTSTPGTVATDIVIIPATATLPTLNTALATAIASLTFTGNSTLTITGQTLTVTGAVTINSAVAASIACTITGSGTLACASFNAGSSLTPTSTQTTAFTSTITALTVTGNLTIVSSSKTGPARNNTTTFTHTSGTITTAGITTNNSGGTGGGAPSCTYTMGNTNPSLNLTSTTPFTIAGTGTNTITLNGTGAMVDYQSTSNVTFLTAPAGLLAYTNLIISGGSGNIKTLAANTTVSSGLTVRAASTLAMSTFTVSGGVTSITMETVGGGNGASITGTGAITLGGNITVNYTGSGAITAGASITPPIALGATTNITVADDGTVNTDFTMSTGVISGVGFGIVKLGTGTLLLSAANTYTGTTTISAGTLMNGAAVAVSTNGPFGNAATAITLGDANTTTNNSSPALLINGAFTMARTITIANQVTSGIYSIGGNTDNNASFTGLITFSQPFSISQVTTTATNTLTISGGITGGVAGAKTVTFNNLGAVAVTTTAISDGTGTTAFNKQNSGILTISASNTHTGGSTLTLGILNINNATALGAVGGTFTIAGGTINNTTAGLITNSANNPIALNGDFTFTGTQNLNLGTGTTTLSANRIVTTTAGTLTLGGAISAATLNLTKAGAGGTLSFGTLAVTLNDLIISAGTIISTSGTLSIARDFTNSGTFTHNSGTVSFNGSGAQSINSGGSSFNNFTITNTGGTCTASTNGITVAATFTTNASTTLDMGTNALSVVTVAHSGTLKTQNISATPITITKTWGGTVQYNSASAQTIVDGNYTNLDGTGGNRTVSSTGTIGVAAAFTVGVGTYTTASSTVDFNGTAAQSIPAFNFNNLTISGNKGVGAITLINGGTIGVAAIFSVTATNTSYTVTGNTFDYNGGGAQTVFAPFTYNILVISNAGTKTILTATAVTCLTFTINNAATIDIPGTATLTVTQ